VLRGGFDGVWVEAGSDRGDEMRYCATCGTRVSEAAKFCPKCGSSTAALPIGSGGERPITQVVGSTSNTTIVVSGLDVAAFVRGLSAGNKVIAIAAVVAVAAFFMPQYAGDGSITGPGLGGAAWLQPLFALALLGSVYAYTRLSSQALPLLAASQAAIAAVYARDFFVLFDSSASEGVAGGYYLLSAAFIAALIGSLLNARSLGADSPRTSLAE